MSKVDDERWRADGNEWNWSLPPKAPRLLRLPIIRHFRALWLSYKIERHYAAWRGLGVRTGYDEWVLYAIARGWC